MAVEYFDLEGKQGKDNQGGYHKVYFAPIDQFATIAKPPAVGAVEGDTVIITGDHIFNLPLADGFLVSYATKATLKLTGETTGERDGHGIMNVAEWFVPGDEAELREFHRKSKNDEFIVLVEDCETGIVLQVGGDCNGASIVGSFDSGTQDSGRKGFTFVATAFQNYLAEYQGAINLKP